MDEAGDQLDRTGSAVELRAWYARYFERFTRLATDERADAAALLDCYAVPLTLATADRVTTLATEEAVLGLVRGLIAQLRQADYAGSETHRLEACPLHVRAAFIEGEFSRRNRAGAVFERFGAASLVVRSAQGWRIAAIIPIPA